ncbi:MAG: hypothetical protein HC936_17850, partial [Leptolyngbyaceae cyanobacterium SU_3_3]|nr:hypothetical protein [Leptolyngbyaceae cyanobacterium SU_3_3]
MKLHATGTSCLDWSGDGLAIGIFEDATELTPELAALDEKLSGTLKDLIAEVEFKGKPGSTVATRVASNSPIRKIAVVGLGKEETFTLDSLRRAALGGNAPLEKGALGGCAWLMKGRARRNAPRVLAPNPRSLDPHPPAIATL